MSRWEEPVTNPFTVLEVLSIDMIEALIPSSEALALQWDDVAAKATPELRLSVSPDAVLRKGSLYLLILDLMVLFQVLNVNLLAVE
jgi:hypothetical protein